jgi:hypothetical protein
MQCGIKAHEARRIPLPAHTIDLLTQFQSQAPEGVPYILLDKERYEHMRAKWQQLKKKASLGATALWSTTF